MLDDKLQMPQERTQARDAAAGFFRGLAAAARGYVGAKVAVAQARNARDLQKAQFALDTARTHLIKQKQDFEAQHQQDTLASQERMHAEQLQSQERLQEVVVDGQKAVAKIRADGSIEVMKLQGEAQQGIAETQAEAGTEQAQIQAGAAQGVAQTQADAQRDVATTQAGAAQGVAETQAGASTEQVRMQAEADQQIAQTQAEAQRYVADVQADIATQGYASQEKITAMQEFLSGQGYAGDRVGVMDEDEWGRFNDMLSKVSQNKDMTIIREIRGGFVTAMQGFIDAATNGQLSRTPAQAQSEEAINFGFSMADMAIINGYQRMIDPGATVREGDVDALIASMAKSEQLRAFVNQFIGTGGRFTPEGRMALAELVLNQYNANVDARSPQLATQMQALLQASGLEGRGIDMGFFNIPQREQRSIDQLLQSGGEWAQEIGQAAPQQQGPTGTVPSREAPGAGGGQADPSAHYGTWSQEYLQGRESGMDDAQLDAGLRSAISESFPNMTPEQLDQAIEQVKSRVQAGGSTGKIGQMNLEIDEAQRMAKLADPKQLSVEDLEDEETYRALKVKFAPAGWNKFTEVEWNRFKGRSYQDMLDAGATEEVARAFIAKLRAEISGSGDWAADVEE